MATTRKGSKVGASGVAGIGAQGHGPEARSSDQQASDAHPIPTTGKVGAERLDVRRPATEKVNSPANERSPP